MIGLRKRINIKNKGITTIFLVVVMLILLPTACTGEQDVVDVTYDPETTYTLKTTDVYSLVSNDSGIVHARLIAKEWLIYGKAKEPFWLFPKGFYGESLDSTFQTDASIKADTAYYWEKKELWKLIGEVEFQNQEGDFLESELLFWDRAEAQIYTDKYFTFTKKDESIIRGIGFRSNQDLTDYIVYESGGEFPFNESPRDSTSNDSIKSSTPRPGPINPASPLTLTPLERKSKQDEAENIILDNPDVLELLTVPDETLVPQEVNENGTEQEEPMPSSEQEALENVSEQQNEEEQESESPE